MFTATAPPIQTKKQPPWPKHYGPMPPDAHGWWLAARLPFHLDCPQCFRAPGALAHRNGATP